LAAETASGFLFQTLLRKTTKGTVVAVGNGTKRTYYDSKIGLCFYGKYAGTELKLEGKII
jgi:co-chaperonin GroES (HSP10)